MDDPTSYLSSPGALLLSVAVALICIPLKITPRVPNWVIPYVAFCLGGIGYCLLETWTAKNFLLGLIIGGCSVGLHQSIKQGKFGLESILGMREEKSTKPPAES